VSTSSRAVASEHAGPLRRGRAGAPAEHHHEDVEWIAFELFARDGFAETTMLDLAAALGVGRRTLLRRPGLDEDDLVPQAIAHAALGVSMAAFGSWAAGAATTSRTA
jgi:hypothetical protein